ncbi:hypothetical protein [Kaistella antarctica]|uniref:Uncharacterized protein n=1 Tax=Kaistella antarctica TaxID=266748 RepID=A0A448NTC8_9FLAO|nr:hypothetical protein [Kaistella antarctica]KEY18126.1 hypothetical protein HY04_06285 [Kaistella antarctica]SEV82915.1 hypothetical protein SAMN05421765_0462 [Kaistella antarctica]VEI00717.1 Uncharacterised protein [Kaistella antarctica]
MSRTLKIFFIVFGLSIFILPKQMVFAQSVIECCDQMSNDECCQKEQTQSCHTENSSKESEKNNCTDDCTQCHSCTVHFVMNYLSPEISQTSSQHLFEKTLTFEYGNFYFSSNFQNIWQPPKTG